MKKEDQKKIPQETVKKHRFSQGLPVLNPFAAGIDVGDTMHDVAISDGVSGHEVRQYMTFTEDLTHLVNWLKSEGITTAAMESTGIYWLNLYLMLEEAGIEPYLVNARHVKNVTGRKKDDTDAIWLQKLHCCGLLQKSFQPEGEIRTLRTYVRQRRNLVLICSDSVRRMQKALELMNIKLHTVISDLLGKTGLQMVRAILSGVRDPEELILMKDPRIKASDADIKKSLTGIWKEEYLFMLEQAFQEYMFYQSQILKCEERIRDILINHAARVLEGDITGLGEKKKKPRKNEFNYTIRPLLKIIATVDLCSIDGISEVSCLEILSEIGTDMTKWRNGKHMAAWVNLAPNTKITGGKIISSKLQKKKNLAGQTLRMCANSLKTCKSPLGDYARKMKSRLGKRSGVVVAAHKLTRIIYTMMKEHIEYNAQIIAIDHEKWKENKIKYFEKQLSILKNTA
ncbi:MAG: IS110 family transposase [Candidatus Saccharibacteria bacterium]